MARDYYPRIDVDKAYGADIIRWPQISRREESKLLSRLHGGDKQARQQARQRLIEGNLRLVLFVVKRLGGADAPDPDMLIAMGNRGLMKAVDGHQPGRGKKFSSFAATCIANEVIKERDRQRRTLMTPLSALTSDDKELHVVDPAAPSPADQAAHNECRAMLGKLLRKLKRRHAQIIRLRYLKGWNMPEIGRKLGVSRQAVEQTLSKALDRLRQLVQQHTAYSKLL